MTDEWITVDGVQKAVPMSPEKQEQHDAYVERKKKPRPVPLPLQLNELFKNLKPNERARFYEKKAAIKLAFDEGDVEAARLMIEKVDLGDAELEPLRKQMLDKFVKE